MNKNIITTWTLMTIMALSVLLTGCSTKAIDLEEYVVVTYKGLDGTGIPQVYFNANALEDLIMEMQESESISTSLAISILVSEIKTTALQKTALSNGDTVSVNISGLEGLSEKYKLSFKNTEQEYTVYGLPEGVFIDVFQDIELEYNGISGEASLLIKNETENPFLSQVKYTSDIQKSIVNGQEIVVTATYSIDVAEEHCYIAETTEKTFIAEGMAEYLNGFSNFTSTNLDTMTQLGFDIITARYQNNSNYQREIQGQAVSWFYGGYSNMESVEFVSTELDRIYFFTPKESNSIKNSIMLCYKIVATDADHTDPHTSYVVIYAKNFLKDTDGNIDILPSAFSFSTYILEETSIEANCLDTNRVDFNIEEIFY